MLLPASLPDSLGSPETSSGVYTPTGYGYNVAVGGLPFLSAAGISRPIRRVTAPYRKQQFDNQASPGEQSLDGWWIRSQQSFHSGAGQRFGDPDSSDDSYAPTRYWQSKGVNPWSPGEVSLLPAVVPLAQTGVRNISSDGQRAVGIHLDAKLFYVDSGGNYSVETPAVSGTPAKSIVTDGTYYYLATTTDIYRRLVSASTVSPWTNIYDFGATFTNVVLGWVKERLVLAADSGIYELTDLDGLPGVAVLPAANWVPPQGVWTPASISESNSSIYVAGTSSGRSVILKFTLSSTGAMPTLTSGTVVANLPQGETIAHIYGYLGRYLAISTSSGPRIAAINDTGDLDVGPVLFDGGAGGFVARGQYLYTAARLPEWGAFEGGLARIDLSTELSPLRFAYASDLSFTTSAVLNATRIYEFEVYGASTGNLALGVPATGSTAVGVETPDKAVNGSVATLSDKFTSLVTPSFLQLDLGSAQSLTRFVIKHAAAGAVNEGAPLNTRAFSIQVSSDAATWTTVVTVTNNAFAVSTHIIQATTARYVRLNVTQPVQLDAVGCGLVPGGLVMATEEGLWLEDSTRFVTSGWLQGPRIRYSTLEPKLYKLLRARAPLLQSGFAVSVVDADSVERNVVGYVAGQTPGETDVGLPSIGPQDYLSVKLTLSSTVNQGAGAIVGGYQLKALPAQPRQRLITLPLWCFDSEIDGSGNVAGGDGTARWRLQMLEAVDTAADTVALQDLDANTVELVTIEEVEFVQTAPPAGFGGLGGIINLTLRTV